MTATLTSGVVVYEQDTGATQEENIPFTYKTIMIFCPDTTDNGDDFTIKLSDYGITTMKFIRGWRHTTESSVLVSENPTTSVSSGSLTITVPGSTANKARTYLVGGI